MPYRIRRVDGGDSETKDTLCDLHEAAFGPSAPLIDTSHGYWWLCYDDSDTPVAFAGMVRSSSCVKRGYLIRSGVLPSHRGRGIQVKLLRAREAHARKLGYDLLVTDTTSNIPSANSLIRAGFKLFQPKHPWAFENTLYWRKDL
jgi:GNAT superfamily N-acetyltransferase